MYEQNQGQPIQKPRSSSQALTSRDQLPRMTIILDPACCVVRTSSSALGFSLLNGSPQPKSSNKSRQSAWVSKKKKTYGYVALDLADIRQVPAACVADIRIHRQVHSVHADTRNKVGVSNRQGTGRRRVGLLLRLFGHICARKTHTMRKRGRGSEQRSAGGQRRRPARHKHRATHRTHPHIEKVDRIFAWSHVMNTSPAQAPARLYQEHQCRSASVRLWTSLCRSSRRACTF